MTYLEVVALRHGYTVAELSAAENQDQLICPECLADSQDLL